MLEASIILIDTKWPFPKEFLQNRIWCGYKTITNGYKIIQEVENSRLEPQVLRNLDIKIEKQGNNNNNNFAVTYCTFRKKDTCFFMENSYNTELSGNNGFVR